LFSKAYKAEHKELEQATDAYNAEASAHNYLTMGIYLEKVHAKLDKFCNLSEQKLDGLISSLGIEKYQSELVEF